MRLRFAQRARGAAGANAIARVDAVPKGRGRTPKVNETAWSTAGEAN